MTLSFGTGIGPTFITTGLYRARYVLPNSGFFIDMKCKQWFFVSIFLKSLKEVFC